MALISEKIKMYAHRDTYTGRISYYTHRSSVEWLTFLGEVYAVVEYDESELADPQKAQIDHVESMLSDARSEFATKEHGLLERIKALRSEAGE